MTANLAGAWRVLWVDRDAAYHVATFVTNRARCPQAAAEDYAGWCNRQAALNAALEPPCEPATTTEGTK